MVQLCLISGADDPNHLDQRQRHPRKKCLELPSSPPRSAPPTSARIIPYTVVFFSGQDENFPAAELNKGSLGRGWQSSRFCSYPQEIVIELECKSNISSLQLLSHEYKIASKVEIFISSDTAWYGEGTKREMKQLGFVSMDPNDKTKHQARELKHIPIDCEAVVVRLLLHTCFMNRLNVYNQVGITALIVTGEPSAEGCLESPPSNNTTTSGSWTQVAGSAKTNNVRDDALNQVDTKTAEEILLLRKEKTVAVQMENYDEAKRLKNLIEQMLILGVQIKALEQQKYEAVQEEDYDTAKSCKVQIEKIREGYRASENSRIDRGTQTINQSSSHESLENAQYLENMGTEVTCPREFQEAWPQTQERHNAHDDNNEMDLSERQDEITKPDQSDSVRKESAESSLEEDPGAASEDNLLPEPLPETIVKELEPIFILIDPFYLDCLYSKHWQLRDKGLQHLGKQLQSQGVTEPVSTIRTIVKLLIRALNDKVSNIFQTSLQVLRMFVQRYSSELPSKEFHMSLNGIIILLLEKLGHPNVRIKEGATEALLFLAMTDEIGLNVLAPHLLKPPKTQASWRPLLGRLQLLYVAIPMFGLQPDNQTGFPVDPLITFIIQSFGSPNGEVRNAAVKATVEAYRFMGPQLEKFIKGVKPAIHEVLIEKFEKVSNDIQKAQFPNSMSEPMGRSQKSNKEHQDRYIGKSDDKDQLEGSPKQSDSVIELGWPEQRKPPNVIKVPIKQIPRKFSDPKPQLSPHYHHEKPFQL